MQTAGAQSVQVADQYFSAPVVSGRFPHDVVDKIVGLQVNKPGSPTSPYGLVQLNAQCHALTGLGRADSLDVCFYIKTFIRIDRFTLFVQSPEMFALLIIIPRIEIFGLDAFNFNSDVGWSVSCLHNTPFAP